MFIQTRLDRFFVGPEFYQPLKYSLIDLPPSVRSRIYSTLHLIQDGHIHLNVFEELDKNREYEPREVSLCCCLMCSERKQEVNDWCIMSSSRWLPLLLTCRTFYLEICPILYSSNHFTVSRSDPGGLDGYVLSDFIVDFLISTHRDISWEQLDPTLTRE